VRSAPAKEFFASFFQKRSLSFFLFLCPPAHAQQVAVTCAWARATLPHQDSSAAYLTLTSKASDTLTSVDAAEAGMVMLHQTMEKNGTSEMSDLDSVSLPPGKPVVLAPGGTHLMLMDMKAPLRAGDTLHLSLHFTKAPVLAVNVPVLAVRAAGPCR
jgi:copper(I)-binding protein